MKDTSQDSCKSRDVFFMIKFMKIKKASIKLAFNQINHM